MTPLNPIVADLVERLDASLHEAFEERAGIVEFDANQPRAHAECLALLDVLRTHPGALSGVTVLQVELDGDPLWVLASDLAFARRHLRDIHAREFGVVELAEAVKKFGGIAQLTHVG